MASASEFGIEWGEVFERAATAGDDDEVDVRRCG